MTEFNRKLQHTLTQRLSENSPLIQVLVGPRQVGKTTALKAALRGRGYYESADSPAPPTHAELNKWWDLALSLPDKILAVDEIQKIPGWSEVIKSRWDRQPNSLKVVLTGSSALLLEKGLRESLAGRFELLRADHWNFYEAHQAFGFDLKTYIEFGCYPGSIPLLKDITRWGAYIRDSIVETVIGRDLMSLAPIENPALLRQTFGIAASSPATTISLQKMLGQLQSKGSAPTLQSYLTLLSQAFLVTGLSKYSANMIREKKSSPKLIVHDNALVRAFARPIEQKITPEIWGFYFENTVGARLLEAGWDVYYWKHRNEEVDFVVHGPQGERYAIEVKSSAIKKEELIGLKSFCAQYKEFEPCLVSGVGQELPGIKSIGADWILSLER